MTTASGHTSAIRASRIIGSTVYNTQGEEIGKIEDVMLDKKSNSIMYGVVGFGGFLGMGEKYHPIPWSTLDYNKSKGGYVVPFSKDELKQAPAHSLSELTENDGLGARDEAYSYYKIEPYWS